MSTYANFEYSCKEPSKAIFLKGEDQNSDFANEYLIINKKDLINWTYIGTAISGDEVIHSMEIDVEDIFRKSFYRRMNDLMEG